MLFRSNRPALGRLEGHGGFLAAGRTRGGGLHAFTSRGTSRAADPFGFTCLAPLGLVLEVLVGEELLFSRRPDEFRAAVY